MCREIRRRREVRMREKGREMPWSTQSARHGVDIQRERKVKSPKADYR